MTTDRTLSSSNRMVWELFQALRRIRDRVGEAHAAKDESAVRQDAAVCVILAVQCVEVFFNIYFRSLIGHPTYAHAAEQICKDLSSPHCGLERKVRKWPLLAFGRSLSLDSGAGQRFSELKKLRNKLMHFTSSYETLSIPGVAIHGLADTGAYDALSWQTAIDALDTAETFLSEVFVLKGTAPSDIPHELHRWTGKPPM